MFCKYLSLGGRKREGDSSRRQWNRSTPFFSFSPFTTWETKEVCAPPTFASSLQFTSVSLIFPTLPGGASGVLKSVRPVPMPPDVGGSLSGSSSAGPLERY